MRGVKSSGRVGAVYGGAPRRPPFGALTALVLAGVTVLTGCTSSGTPSPGGTSASAGASPSPRPTPVWNRTPASVAAVGDSMTRGFDACGVLVDCPEVSWATGTDSGVRSLAYRLLGGGSADVAGRTEGRAGSASDQVARRVAERSWNLAATGARMADVPAQMTRAARHRPELVTVMAGANDACRKSAAQMTPVASFRTSFEEALRRLRADAPKAQVYVSSVPDLKRLWSTGRANPLGRQVWKLGICATMLGDSQDDSKAAQARRDLVYARVVGYNTALKEVCAKDERCRYDGGEVFAYRFTGTQLSHWDWFHPSKDGQRRLAEIAYRNVTAESPPA
ncbi:SGNH/GDSL hydrolase family protein [Streptomyces sp. NPDC093085]|uniref:SGNH/GDSL hydrolase family protein n=1 Tax=Streptomyces sp. NPDC093085 TaxID=3155068 RepID=UPI0034422480